MADKVYVLIVILTYRMFVKRSGTYPLLTLVPVLSLENVKIRMKHVVDELLLKYYYLDVRHVRGRPRRLLGLLWRWWAGGVRPGSTLCFLLESRVAKSIAFSPDATTKRDSTTAKQLRTARLTDSLTPPLRGFLFFTTPPQQ